MVKPIDPPPRIVWTSPEPPARGKEDPETLAAGRARTRFHRLCVLRTLHDKGNGAKAEYERVRECYMRAEGPTPAVPLPGVAAVVALQHRGHEGAEDQRSPQVPLLQQGLLLLGRKK